MEQTPLGDRLLAVMRDAAAKSLAAGEQFVTPRSLLLALLDDPDVGPALRGVVVRDRLEAIEPDEHLPGDEQPAVVRCDTLAFKTPDGDGSVWLNLDALKIFVEGAQRAAQSEYSPKHLAFGFAAEAARQPGMLAAMHLDAGPLVDAMYRL